MDYLLTDSSKRYLDVRKDTYQVFEYHFLPFIRNLLDKDFLYRDLVMLYRMDLLIKKDLKRPTDIARNTGTSKNNLSYRLHRLEELGLISRHKNLEDFREWFIELTPKGTQLIDIYLNIFKAFSNQLKASMSAFELIALTRAYTKVANHFSDESPIVFNPLKISQYPDWIQLSGTRFYNEVIHLEDAFLAEHNIPCSLKEWGILLEIYLGHHTLSMLKEVLPHPISTISTIVKKYESTIVSKIQDQVDGRIFHLTINDAWHPVFEAYLSLRLDIADRIQNILSKKEYAMMFKAFKALKKMTLNPDAVFKEATHESATH